MKTCTKRGYCKWYPNCNKVCLKQCFKCEAPEKPFLNPDGELDGFDYENAGCKNIVSEFVTCGTKFKDGVALCTDCKNAGDAHSQGKNAYAQVVSPPSDTNASSCCNAPIMHESDVCSKCKEHCTRK